MAITIWQPYKSPSGEMVKDPIAASVLGGNNPNSSGGIWSYNQDSDTWTQNQTTPAKTAQTSQPTSTSQKAQTNVATPKGLSMASSGISLGGSSKGYEGQLLSQIMSMINNKPVNTGGNLKPYEVQDMSYSEALAQTGPSYQMKSDEELSKRAQLIADLEINPQRKEAERQQQQADLRYHNDMRKAELMYAGKDQVAQDLANKMDKQNAIDQAARGGAGRSGLADYQRAKVNEAVGQQLTALEINKQSAMYEIESQYGLTTDQIDGALSDLETMRGKLSVEAFESLSDREQALYLQQENARSQVAMHIMDQFLAGEQMKLTASLAAIESADKKFANELQAWLGGLDASLKAYSTLTTTQLEKEKNKLAAKGLDLDYLKTMLPYTNLTADQTAGYNIAWTELMGETPRR